MLSAQIQESPEPNVLALCLIDELYSVVAQLGGADMAQPRARFKQGPAWKPKGKGKQDNILDF